MNNNKERTKPRDTVTNLDEQDPKTKTVVNEEEHDNANDLTSTNTNNKKNEDDPKKEEREEAALLPDAIVCSFCGLPETATRDFSKTKCPCKSTWYCNTKCQKKHRKGHRNECKRLIAEIKRKKKEKDAHRELDKSTRVVDTGTSNVAVAKVEHSGLHNQRKKK